MCPSIAYYTANSVSQGHEDCPQYHATSVRKVGHGTHTVKSVLLPLMKGQEDVIRGPLELKPSASLWYCETLLSQRLSRSHRLAWPRTEPSQGLNTGSNPVGTTKPSLLVPATHFRFVGEVLIPGHISLLVRECIESSVRLSPPAHYCFIELAAKDTCLRWVSFPDLLASAGCVSYPAACR
jgi:hypothetical protein